MSELQVEKPINSDEQDFWDKAMITITAGLLASEAEGTADDFVSRAVLVVSVMLRVRRAAREQ